MLAAYTHMTVGDFIMSNWTDIHFVDQAKGQQGILLRHSHFLQFSLLYQM